MGARVLAGCPELAEFPARGVRLGGSHMLFRGLPRGGFGMLLLLVVDFGYCCSGGKQALACERDRERGGGGVEMVGARGRRVRVYVVMIFFLGQSESALQEWPSFSVKSE